MPALSAGEVLAAGQSCAITVAFLYFVWQLPGIVRQWSAAKQQEREFYAAEAHKQREFQDAQAERIRVFLASLLQGVCRYREDGK